MRKTSVRDLHIRTSELVREAAEGATIVIERRGEPVAELRPYTKPRGISAEEKERIFREMQDLWSKMPSVRDSTDIISEDRNRFSVDD